MSNGSIKALEINSKLIVCEHFMMYNVFTTNRSLEIWNYMFNYFLSIQFVAQEYAKLPISFIQMHRYDLHFLLKIEVGTLLCSTS